MLPTDQEPNDNASTPDGDHFTDGDAATTTGEAGSTYWSSRLAFILAATGSAVGLGNIWKFPYVAGENGGGAFVIIYLLCIFAIGLPIMMSEIMLGRRARKNPIAAMRQLAEESGRNIRWAGIGKMGVVAGFLILSFYSVIAGWSLAYVFRAMGGMFAGIDITVADKIWTDLSTDAERTLAWHSIFMIMVVVIISRGVSGGLEKMIKLLMPMLFLLLLVLVGISFSIGDADKAIDYLFTADFSKLTIDVVADAMGQAFFSLSLGMGAILMYGAYLPKNASVAKTSLAIVSADTAVALISGLAIFPLVFATAGLEPTAGFSLVFKALPQIFGQIEGGSFVGTLFFALLFIAALTSAVSLLEPIVSWMVSNKGYERTRAARVSGFITWFLGLGTVFSFSIWADDTLTIAPKIGERIYVLLENQTIFSMIDFTASNIMLPLGGALMAYFVGFVMKPDIVREEMSDMGSALFKVWYFMVRNVAPVAGVVIFAKVTGIWDAMKVVFGWQ